MVKSLGDMIFHRLDGDLQLYGDLFIRETMKSLQDNDPFTNGRQSLDGGIDLVGSFKHCLPFRLDLRRLRPAMYRLYFFLRRFFFKMIDQQAAGDDKDLLFQRMIGG